MSFELNKHSEGDENGKERISEILDKSESALPEKSPGAVKKLLGRIRDAYRGIMSGSIDSKNKEQLSEKLKTELRQVSKEAIREGVDFSKCQMDDLLRDYNSGRRFEFETFSPYLADYNMATGEIWDKENLMPAVDKIGLLLGAALREVFSKARIISLYDEYNSDMPSSEDSWGKPTRQIVDVSGKTIDAPQLEFPDETKRVFRSSVEKTMRKNGMIRQGDEEGKDYLFVSESEKIKDAEVLVARLEEKGFIQKTGEAIDFVNPQAENPLYQKIPLRTKSGRWLCEALDASSYIKPENLEITHLVVLPNFFEEQQDKVWEILRTLGIDSTHYHNIFYSADRSPEEVTKTVLEEIEKHKK